MGKAGKASRAATTQQHAPFVSSRTGGPYAQQSFLGERLWVFRPLVRSSGVEAFLNNVGQQTTNTSGAAERQRVPSFPIYAHWERFVNYNA
jgi:hypothetical protein